MKKRIITALILTAIVLPLILLGGIYYLIGIMVLTSLCSYELTTANKSPITTKIIAILLVLLATLYSYFNPNILFINYNLLFIFIPFLIYFIIALFDKKGTLLDACYNSIFTIILSIFASSLLKLRFAFNNANLIAYLLIVTAAVDSFALFIGCKFGKHRLNERVSPKKSIEGSIGGIVGGTIIATLFATFFPILTTGEHNFLNLSFSSNIILNNFCYSLLITILLTIIGQIGDLIFSLIKRNYGIKDFSNALPGHGGFADRIDSLCLNSITLAIILSLMGIL
jgi:phosphatidate cytidylyltransferase